jgi:hypothetical protein
MRGYVLNYGVTFFSDVISHVLMSPPFGFFRKREASKEDNKDNIAFSSDGISLEQASVIIEEIMTNETKSLLVSLEPIRESVENTLDNLGRIVEDLSKENLKTEDTKFKSLVENSRRTIVATVMRESSSQIPMPKNPEEAIEFKNRLESLLKRCGDASGSHRRVLNEYMKKHSNKMKGEFETLSSLYKKTNELVSKQEAKIERCSQCLKLLKNVMVKMETTESDRSRIVDLLQENKDDETLVEKLINEEKNLKTSPDYSEAFRTLAEIKRIQDQKEQVKKDISNMFSTISRAITKYSYGTSKVTYLRLEKMANRPWEIFDEELSPYFQLLHEIKKEIINQKIVLKDSNKVMEYIDHIVNALDSFSMNIKQKDDTLYRLKTSGASQFQDKLQEIQAEINKRNELLLSRKLEVDDYKKGIDIRFGEVNELAKQLELDILDITGTKYHIKTSYS